MSVNISGVPFNTANPVQDGRIVGGNSANIGDHPHQVKLLNSCWNEILFRCIDLNIYKVEQYNYNQKDN